MTTKENLNETTEKDLPPQWAIVLQSSINIALGRIQNVEKQLGSVESEIISQVQKSLESAKAELKTNVTESGAKTTSDLQGEFTKTFNTLNDRVQSLDSSVDSFKAIIFQMVYAQSQILAEILVYKTYLVSLDDRTRIVDKNVVELLNKKAE